MGLNSKLSDAFCLQVLGLGGGVWGGFRGLDLEALCRPPICLSPTYAIPTEYPNHGLDGVQHRVHFRNHVLPIHVDGLLSQGLKLQGLGALGFWEQGTKCGMRQNLECTV